ncbi:S-adenosylmethionine:tRNA ribosyltransferase-isomerase [Streptomyces sp. NPDC047108]|uniref:S-adenosylmethionine:tRNA ribosyltransferase-isomerase n=1 Tax=Streptomyces sp. NPDC047108 TaxID=3155025 RepID=UPI0033CC9CB4
MSAVGALRVPDELSARVPAEQRGGGRGRDGVRLLVSRGPEVSHHTFPELPRLLGAGDVLVVNTSLTLPAAVDGRLGDGRGERVVVHFSTRGDDGRRSVELRTPDGRGSTRPRPVHGPGAFVRLPGGASLVLEEPLDGPGGRLWWARPAGAEVPALLRRYGRAIRYAYTERDQALSAYQTVFGVESPDGDGSAEMPSAARPFTAPLVAELVSRGVHIAPVTLHTGVASLEAHEPPYPERFTVPEATARLVNAVRRGARDVRGRNARGRGREDGARGRGRGDGARGRGDSARGRDEGGCASGRIVAVGTTVVRALETVALPSGLVRAASGWTDLVVTPERGVRVVDGLLTGLHEPEASHLLMLEAVAGREALDRAYEAALHRRYLWHEFGDVHLMLPASPG